MFSVTAFAHPSSALPGQSSSSTSSKQVTTCERQIYYPQHVDNGIMTQLTFATSSGSTSSSTRTRIVGLEPRDIDKNKKVDLASESKSTKVKAANYTTTFSKSRGRIDNDIRTIGDGKNGAASGSDNGSGSSKFNMSTTSTSNSTNEKKAINRSASYSEASPNRFDNVESNMQSTTNNNNKGSLFQRGMSRLMSPPSRMRSNTNSKRGSFNYHIHTRQTSDATSITSAALSEDASSATSSSLRLLNIAQAPSPLRTNNHLSNQQMETRQHLTNILNYCEQSPLLQLGQQHHQKKHDHLEVMTNPSFNRIRNEFENTYGRSNLLSHTTTQSVSSECESDNQTRRAVQLRRSISYNKDDPLYIDQDGSNSITHTQGDVTSRLSIESSEMRSIPDMDELLDQEMLEAECQKLIREQIIRLYEQEHYRSVDKQRSLHSPAIRKTGISPCLTMSTANSSSSSSTSSSSSNRNRSVSTNRIIKMRSSLEPTVLDETDSQTIKTPKAILTSSILPTVTTIDARRSRSHSIGGSGDSKIVGTSSSHRYSRRLSLGEIDMAEVAVIPTGVDDDTNKNISVEIQPDTLQINNTGSSKLTSKQSNRSKVVPQTKLILPVEIKERSTGQDNTANSIGRTLFQTLSIQPSFLSLASKNSASQQSDINTKLDKSKNRRLVTPSSSFVPSILTDGSVNGAGKPSCKAVVSMNNDDSKKTALTKGATIKRSRATSRREATSVQNLSKHRQRSTMKSSSVTRSSFQRNQSTHSRNTTRSAGPIDVDSVAELYGDDSSSERSTMSIRPDQSSLYGPTIATAIITVPPSTPKWKGFFDYLPCMDVDDDDLFCPPLVDGAIEQVSPTQLGIVRQRRHGFSSSIKSSSSNISFTFSEGGVSTADQSIISEASEGPVDVDDFIPKDSYYLYDRHYIVLDETDISRGLVGYEVGFEPEIPKDIDASYKEYKKVSNIWNVPSAIYEDAAEDINEDEDGNKNVVENASRIHQSQTNHNDFQFLSKVIDRIDKDEDDEYDHKYRINKRDTTCRTNMFSL